MFNVCLYSPQHAIATPDQPELGTDLQKDSDPNFKPTSAFGAQINELGELTIWHPVYDSHFQRGSELGPFARASETDKYY